MRRPPRRVPAVLLAVALAAAVTGCSTDSPASGPTRSPTPDPWPGVPEVSCSEYADAYDESRRIDGLSLNSREWAGVMLAALLARDGVPTPAPTPNLRSDILMYALLSTCLRQTSPRSARDAAKSIYEEDPTKFQPL